MPFQIGSVAVHDDGQHRGSAKRAGASGVASLDAASLVPNAQNPAVNTTHIAAAHPHSGHVISSSGQYVGNDTVNRAIPHGLGVTPRYVFIYQLVPGTPVSIMQIITPGESIICTNSGTDANYTIAGIDSVNFYVGNALNYNNSANASGWNMAWVAFS